MTKHIRTFSEGISTHGPLHKPASRSSKPISPKFFRSYQEVEIAMGPPEFQKLMKELRAWKKSGKKGVFKAKFKGPKGEVKLGVSGVDLSAIETKELRQETKRLVREWLPEFIGSKQELVSGIQRAWDAGFSPEYLDSVMATSIRGGAYDWSDIEYIKAAWGNSWISDEFLASPYNAETFSTRVPQGDNYHCSVGWY